MGLQIDHFGHTSFQVVAGDVRFMIDPVLVRADLNFPTPTCPEWLSADLADVDAIVLSHAHDDHLHPPSLLGFSPGTPVYVFNGAGPRALESLAQLGFVDVRAMRAGEPLVLGRDVVVHPIPAAPSAEGSEQCCFLVESPDAIVLDAVDIRDTAVTRAALEPYREHVDLAFLPVGSSVQWQGGWNQMDPVHAVAFAEWLQPALVAPCGGALSLAEAPRLGAVSRYPNTAEDWWSVAAPSLGPQRLLAGRPPCRVSFRNRTIQRCSPIHPASTFTGQKKSGPPVGAALTTVFTGYDPRRPTIKLPHGSEDLARWDPYLSSVRSLLSHSGPQLQHLLARCGPAACLLPGALLAPCTFRELLSLGALATAAQLLTAFPGVGDDSVDLELAFFAPVEALISNATDVLDDHCEHFLGCLWLDRRMHTLRQVHLTMKARSGLPADLAEQLLEEHLGALRSTAGRRHPTLGPNHIVVPPELLGVLDGVFSGVDWSSPDIAAALVFPNPTGVQALPLSTIEVLLLEACDGRALADVAELLVSRLGVTTDEADAALWAWLSTLTRASVVVIDWSR